jgi:hypothetical protein
MRSLLAITLLGLTGCGSSYVYHEMATEAEKRCSDVGGFDYISDREYIASEGTMVTNYFYVTARCNDRSVITFKIKVDN